MDTQSSSTFTRTGPSAEVGPSELIEKIEKCWNAQKRYELIFVSIARDPVARRLATPHVEQKLCPWRKTILITERNTCRVEEWMKLYGIGSVSNSEERYRVEKITWSVHVFGREKLTAPNREGEAASE